MSDKEETDRVRISQVLAGALAAVTAALIGSTMGVAGTVIGAGVASMVSTIGGALYLRSIERTTKGVRTVRAKVVGKSGGTTVLVADEDPEKEPGDEVEAEPVVVEDETAERPPEERRRLRWPMLVVASLAAFALGMLAVTGVEWLRGESLSGDGGSTFGSIVDRQHDDGDTRQEQPVAPTTSSTTTTTDAPEESTSSTTDPTSTTTTPPSSDSSTTTTTTEPPATTTTEVEPPGGSVIPTN